MENVLKQAELLGEAILDSDEYMNMRLAQQAAMKDETAVALVSAVQEKRKAMEDLLTASEVDHEALAAAGKELDEAQKAVDANPVIDRIRKTNAAFSSMMNQVNNLIRYTVTGENPDNSGCTGSCATCGGCH